EIADKEWKLLRIIAISVPVLAVPIVQAYDAHKASLAEQKTTLVETRERARDLEGKVRELLVDSPRDTVEAIRNADVGFEAKAGLLAFRASVNKALLVSMSPDAALALSDLPTEPAAQIQIYRTLEGRPLPPDVNGSR